MAVKVSIHTAKLGRIAAGLKLKSADFKQANQVAAPIGLDEIQGYYESKGRNFWLNKRLPTHGAGRKMTRWADKIASTWATKKVNSNGVSWESGMEGLAHKVEGGTIRPKRAKWLTIPLIPQAHGMKASEYSAGIAPLFRIKNFLAQRDTNIEGDGIKIVFALKKSVTHAPWKGALPPESEYMEPFAEAVADELLRITESR